MNLLRRMKRILHHSRSDARKRKHISAKISAEGLVLKWVQQQGRCAACGLPLDLLKAHHDHDHKTGESRGFLHPQCNTVEGFIKKLPEKNRRQYLMWLRHVTGDDTCG